MKIQHFLNKETAYSLRQVIELIKKGQVKINGQIIYKPQHEINPNRDIIQLKNQQINHSTTYYYYKFNKPKDVISTLKDPKARTDLSNFYHRIPQQVFPVGRLDRKTTGLLLFTNDGDLSHRISHPKHKLNKEYKVTLDKRLTHQDFQRLSTGIILNDGPVVFDQTLLLDKHILMVSIREGRNRIIRRTFEYLGYKVEKLKRTAIGPIQLDNLKVGDFKPLTKKEIQSLKACFAS
jgi:pseudouridine synthase